MASTYDDELWERVPVERAEPAHVVEFVQKIPRLDSLLDLGCGDGLVTRHLDSGGLVAADVSALALERARARLGQVKLVELDPDAPLPFADNAFDGVVCVETIEHVRDVQLFVSEIRRVLRPGAGLWLTTPACGRLYALAALVLGFERRFDPLDAHLRFFTRSSLARLLGEMGFELEGVERRAGTLLARARR